VEAIHPIMAGGAVLTEWPVCNFHDAALSAGEVFEVSGKELLLGTDTIPGFMNMMSNEDGFGQPVVTIVVGHDGVESARFTFHVNDEQLSHLWGFPPNPEV
jgi:hypothetical protein